MRVQEEIKLHVIKTSKLVEELSQNLNGRSVKLGAGREGIEEVQKAAQKCLQICNRVATNIRQIQHEELEDGRKVTRLRRGQNGNTSK
jgi:hypothetical protein